MNEVNTSALDQKVSSLEASISSLAGSVSKLETTIYGNGRPGLREEVVKLRQALKVATWVAAIIGAVMVTDFVDRKQEVQPSEVKSTLDKFAERQTEVQESILLRLESIEVRPK